MTALRRRMLEDMEVRNLSAGTQQVYLQHISRFAHYCGRSPAELGPEEIRAYQLYVTNEKQLAPATLVIVVAALRFLYRITLQKTWPIAAVIPAPKKPQTLPVVLSLAEMGQFLDSVQHPKHRTILTTCYAAGLRIAEAVRLTVPAIDSQRMVLRIVQGKGPRDRYVMLSPRLLAMLRDWWRVSQPHHWLFPGKRPGRPRLTGWSTPSRPSPGPTRCSMTSAGTRIGSRSPTNGSSISRRGRSDSATPTTAGPAHRDRRP